MAARAVELLSEAGLPFAALQFLPGDGREIGESDALGTPLLDDHLLIILNASPDTVRFCVPETLRTGDWRVRFDTCHTLPPDIGSRSEIDVAGRSLIVLSQTIEEE